MMTLNSKQHGWMSYMHCKTRYYTGIFLLTPQWVGVLCGINTFTCMPNPLNPPSKSQSLKASGAFNPRADRVHHFLFEESEFFDPQDLPQLKYEALRALQLDDYSICRASAEFGLSRPTLYQAQAHFEQQGLEGLLPRKRGPKKPHKLTPEVQQHLQALRATQPHLDSRELARRLRQKFKVSIHPRTIEKALKPKAKRGRQSSP